MIVPIVPTVEVELDQRCHLTEAVTDQRGRLIEAEIDQRGRLVAEAARSAIVQRDHPTAEVETTVRIVHLTAEAATTDRINHPTAAIEMSVRKIHLAEVEAAAATGSVRIVLQLVEAATELDQTANSTASDRMASTMKSTADQRMTFCSLRLS